MLYLIYINSRKKEGGRDQHSKMSFLYGSLSFSVPIQDTFVSTLAFSLYIHTLVPGIWLGTGNHCSFGSGLHPVKTNKSAYVNCGWFLPSIEGGGIHFSGFLDYALTGLFDLSTDSTPLFPH